MPKRKTYRFIALDFETTGLDPFTGAEIIEIGAVRCDQSGQLGETFSSFCKPSKSIPPEATEISGITDDDVREAPPAWGVWQDFLRWAGDFDALVAHNAPFEAEFISALYNAHGVALPDFSFVDTLRMARRKIGDVRNYKLPTLKAHFGIKGLESHRAADDAKACALLLIKILATYKKPSLALSGNKKPILEMLDSVHREREWKESRRTKEEQLASWKSRLEAEKSRGVKLSGPNEEFSWEAIRTIFLIALAALVFILVTTSI